MSTEVPVYEDPDARIERRVEDLLERMTVEEKAGQLVGMVLGQFAGEMASGDMETVKESIQEYNLGSVGAFMNLHNLFDPDEAVKSTNELQRTAVEETNLGIPLLFPLDCIHGHSFVEDTTVFPHNLGMAATKDPDLIRDVAKVTRKEMQATGANQNYQPTADIARDQRWGRTLETYGESPRLAAEMVDAEVEGYQGDGLEEGVISTPKHFPAYGEGERGEDAAPVDISETTLHRFFLPPWKAAIDAGVGAIMPCYNSIDAEPVHGSKRYLTQLLRGKLDFDGFLSSDWNGVEMLHEDFRTAADSREAAYQAIKAGLDITSVGGPNHVERLIDLVESDDISEAVLDRSVERVIRAKFELGLFEDPYVDPDGTDVVGSQEHQELSLEAARDVMTLLKNEDEVLPFDPDVDEVLVTGPNADELLHQVGGWTNFDPNGTTVLEGIRDHTEATVTHEPGAGIREPKDIDAARDAAEDADAAVVVLGENWYMHEFGMQEMTGETGTFPMRLSLSLPGAQRNLLEAVHETGTPTALVLITGRPLAIQWAADNVLAILMAYYPGPHGGPAIAETLFGENNPSGTLPISVPRSAAHIPTRFNYLPHPHPIGDREHPPSYDPLFEFGHGLSYTEFEYSDLSISPSTIGRGGTVEVTVEVANVGDREGGRAVHCYLRDEASSRVTPERELASVEKVSVEPGEERTVTFEIPIEEFGVVNPDGEQTVEPGEYVVFVGDDEARFAVESEYWT